MSKSLETNTSFSSALTSSLSLLSLSTLSLSYTQTQHSHTLHSQHHTSLLLLSLSSFYLCSTVNGRISPATMKISGKPHLAPAFPSSLSSKAALNPRTDSDLQSRLGARKPARRKPRTPRLARVRRNGAPNGRRSRPETPLLKWKVEDGEEREKVGNEVADEDEKAEESGRRTRRRGREVPVSARKLAAGLWRLQMPEAVASGAKRSAHGQLGFEVSFGL